ncbi:unnamed protein product [Amoebophrya sp. A120]|nr:unnamed protein product [Amoebophrya sp. A120]|eukprot:GSA120T00010148001.1
MSSFSELLAAAAATVGDNAIDPLKAKEMMDANPDMLILDVQDPTADFKLTIPNSYNASLGTLGFKADVAMTDFLDKKITEYPKDKNVMVTCGIGGQAMLGAKLMIDYGWKNTFVCKGGNAAWKEAKCPLCAE